MLRSIALAGIYNSATLILYSFPDDAVDRRKLGTLIDYRTFTNFYHF